MWSGRFPICLGHTTRLLKSSPRCPVHATYLSVLSLWVLQSFGVRTLQGRSAQTQGHAPETWHGNDADNICSEKHGSERKEETMWENGLGSADSKDSFFHLNLIIACSYCGSTRTTWLQILKSLCVFILNEIIIYLFYSLHTNGCRTEFREPLRQRNGGERMLKGLHFHSVSRLLTTKSTLQRFTFTHSHTTIYHYAASLSGSRILPCVAAGQNQPSSR